MSDPVREALAELVAWGRERNERRGRNAGSPYHAHSVPGVWDDDNGDLAGKPCAECAMWDRAAALAAAPAPAPDAIKVAVDRFLSWPLPQGFSPDCGISFDGRKPDQWNPNKGWPVGTNLFTKEQARAMFEYCLAAAPAQPDDGDGCRFHCLACGHTYPCIDESVCPANECPVCGEERVEDRAQRTIPAQVQPATLSPPTDWDDAQPAPAQPAPDRVDKVDSAAQAAPDALARFGRNQYDFMVETNASLATELAANEAQHRTIYEAEAEQLTRPYRERAERALAERDAYMWGYFYLQARMESLDRHGWAHDCDGEIAAWIAARGGK